MKDLDWVAKSRAVMAGTVGEEAVGKSLGAPGTCVTQAELCGLFAHGVFNPHRPVIGGSCLNVSEHPSNGVVTCIPPIKETLYALAAKV